MLRRLWFRIHWLLGVSAGTVLALLGATGSLLAFEDEIVDWLNRDVREVQAHGGEPLAPPALLAGLRELRPEQPVLGLLVPADPAGAVRVTYGARRGEARGRRGWEERIYADPYTGQLLEGGMRGAAFFADVRELHRFLLLSKLGQRDLGRNLVGGSVLCCVVLLLSGLYLRWPRRIGSLRAWFGVQLRRRGRPLLWNLHAVFGTAALAVYAIITTTGLQWSFPWWRAGLYTLAGVERERGRDEEGAGERGAPPPIDLARSWTTFVQTTRVTGYRWANLTLPRSAGRPLEIVYLEPDAAHERALSRVRIDPESGELLAQERYADKTAGAKFIASVFALHTGSFFGLPGQLLFVLAALGMPFLAISGWLMYAARRTRAAASSPPSTETARTISPTWRALPGRLAQRRGR